LTPTKVDQTIFVTDHPKRLGNCVAACVASALGLRLEQVPHFIEFGIYYGDKPDPKDTSSGSAWFAMMAGFFAGHGVWPVTVESVDHAEPGELVFVHGPSPRGVGHQVLYRDGRLWHDPHPSRDGLLSISTDGSLFVLRPLPEVGFDHAPVGRAREAS
jgi:hypothetical protein